MQKSPAARFENADAMRSALEQLAGGSFASSGELAAFLPLPAETGTHLADRADFDRFAKRLVLTRFIRALVPAVLIAGIGGALYANFLEPAAPITAEQEPNDDPYKATLLTPPSYGGVEALERALDPGAVKGAALPRIHALLGKRRSKDQGDVDFYVFEIKGAQRKTVFAAVEGLPNIDLVLELLGENPKAPGRLSVFARSDRKGVARNEALPNLELSPGRYYLQVRQVQVGDQDGVLPLPVENVSDSYQLALALLPSGLTEEHEPNDNHKEAAPLLPGSSATGMVGVTDSEDWWLLTGSGAANEASGATDKPELELGISAPPDSTLIAELRFPEDLERGRRRARAKLRIEPGTTGTLTVKPKAAIYLRLRTERSLTITQRYSLSWQAKR